MEYLAGALSVFGWFISVMGGSGLMGDKTSDDLAMLLILLGLALVVLPVFVIAK